MSQELIRLQTPDFELSVWCKDISKRHRTLVKTLHERSTVSQQSSELRFSPPLTLNEIDVKGKSFAATKQTSHYMLDTPLFFENVQYQFEWIFFDKVEDARLTHRVNSVNDGFRFAGTKGRMPSRLTGVINTGNDIGWMRLPLEYVIAEKTAKLEISFEVLPTKMDLHSDLPAMYKSIDKEFPLWRFSLAEKTEQDVAKGKHRGDFPLLWLANFGHLRKQLENGLKVIAQAPHNRLQARVSYSKGDRLKGRIPHRLGTRVKEDIANGLHDKQYRIENKQLSVDTPENRFIKMVVTSCKKRLGKFEAKIRQHNNKAPDNQRLSEQFLSELQSWQEPLKKILGQSFLKEVSPFSGRHRESLVLQQKTGYSTVYRVWQELKFYLDLFDNQTSISMKSVAEIYEIWCFLTIKSILEKELGFEQTKSSKQDLEPNDFFEYQLKDGFAGAFKFKRSDGMKAKLVHEPKFSDNTVDIRSYLVSQKPDIVLEVTIPLDSGEKSFIWLFDAKYRIKADNRYDKDKTDDRDMVPDDAINQMHRYRDALIRITKDSNSSHEQKSRPVFGAFALYPGYFDQGKETNHYADAIKEIGIGAFPLLPCENNTGSIWLKKFLTEQIGKPDSPYSTEQINEALHVKEAARIPYYGMEQTLYPDLLFTAALGGKTGRRKEYFEKFENGSAKWYHTPLETFENVMTKSRLHVIDEIRYLGIATNSSAYPRKKSIKKVWPVIRYCIQKRNLLSEEQTGKESKNNSDCILFELGDPLTLKEPVENIDQRQTQRSMLITTLSRLQKETDFNNVEEVYELP